MSILQDAGGSRRGVGCDRGQAAAERTENSRPIRRRGQTAGTARRGVRVLAVGAAAAAVSFVVSPGGAAASSTGPGGCQWQAGIVCPGPWPVASVAGHVDAIAADSPLPTSQCLAQAGIRCYSPAQLRTAYDLGPLYQRGITGRGRTIIIVDPLGSPTLQHDLDVYDAQWALPPITLNIKTFGQVPPFDPNSPDSIGWAGETTLDVEAAHAIAPDANIIVAVTAVSETEGVTGFPQIMQAEKTLIDAHAGDVISQSFGASEATFPSTRSLTALRYAYQDAARRGISVFAASGDTGAAGIGADGQSLLPNPAVIWPASDPEVTAVGGTELTLDDSGARLAADRVWNDNWGAGGGGLSSVFARPAYQNGVRSVVGGRRAIPDVSLSAAVDGGLWVYQSFAKTGWHIYGGTSASTPQMAAIVTLADQVAGHDLGNINPLLYRLGQRRDAARSGIVDVTAGDNSFGGITGYSAAPGYDLASGLGTVDAARLVLALAHFGH